MTTRVLLIRHATHDLLGRTLCGRMDHVSLNPAGLAQAERLAAVLATEPATLITSSPLTRAQQTAAPIARAHQRDLLTEAALNEIDTGEWTGHTFEALAADPRWIAWNTDRLHHRAPAGETMLEVQARVAAWLERMGAGSPDRTVVAVSHADVIKAACCHALGLSPDNHARFDIDPASITTLVVGAWGLKLVRLNQAPP